MSGHVRRVGPDAAAEVLAVVQEAFGARPVLDPPADPDARADLEVHAPGRVRHLDHEIVAAAGARPNAGVVAVMPLLLRPCGRTTAR